MVGAALLGGGGLFLGWILILNGPIESLDLPSLAMISMSAVSPTLASAGTPESWPVVVSKLAQAGLPVMLKVSVSLSASVAFGMKTYMSPALTSAAGVPASTGALLPPVGGGFATGGDSSTGALESD